MASLPDSLPHAASKIRFGLFEADLATGELWKQGIRIRIQAQPFRILTLLVERPGEVVTRAEMQRRIWGQGTNVDFDHSLGTAINKLREALGDSAENPRFIETLARRGYRFLAPVVEIGSTLPVPHHAFQETGVPSDDPDRHELVTVTALDAVTAAGGESISPSHATAKRAPLRWPILLCCAAALLIAAISFAAGWSARQHPELPSPITQITQSGRISPGDPQLESLPATATDGARIYFPLIEEGRSRLAEALIADGETTTLDLPDEIAAPAICDISPDGSKLLLRNHLDTSPEQSLWVVSTNGRDARRIPGILAHDATWMPDGQRILFASGNDLYIAREDGSESRKLATVPGRAFWLRWSPNGSELRFTLLNTKIHSEHLWRIGADGKGAQPLLSSSDGAECCGNWTPDGKEFVFQKSAAGASNIWMLRDRQGWLGNNAKPIPMTNGPLSYRAPITARVGGRVFFIGLDVRSELLQFDSGSGLFIPYSGTLESARRVEYSRDGQWMAWIRPEDGSLWRSRSNGSERVQLTAAPTEVFMMHWRLDDRQLVLMARQPEKPWTLYTVDASGGSLQPLHAEDRNQADPDWSPDQMSIVFGRLPELMAEVSQPKAIYLYKFGTGAVTKLPGSDGLFSPRWSPNGKYIAALSIDQKRLMLYDSASQTWRQLAQQTLADPTWSHDSQSIFFHDFEAADQPLYKVEIASGKVTRVASLKSLRAAGAVDYRFAGLGPHDTPLVEARTSTANLYSMATDHK